ncbi:MAG: GGDEF domain-containing protein [Aquabacterium sp.]|jgi:diguanylate cyclase|uniref:GGDEF domain-containing protein n=1 Tax=Aquabacterium sp. TaxID=1872578 RepID=UPI003BAFEE5A
MTTLSSTPPWVNWITGTGPVRRHVMFGLGAGLIYALTAAIMAHSAWLGLISAGVFGLLLGCMATTFLLFFVLVRSGWSQRFEDPVLAMPHGMVSILIIVLAYVLIGEYRGDTIILLAQAVAVAMFRLRPRQCLFLGGWAALCVSVAQFGLVWSGEPGFSLQRGLTHFTVSAVSLMALAVVAMWISAMRVRISRQSDELRQTLVQAQALATTDMLTGLLNRRAMTDQLESELARVSRSGNPVCVALIDIDHFKKVNDHYGHRMGDEVLRSFASLAQGDLRQVDQLGRWGGEEFLLMMPHVDASQAWVAVERLRNHIAAHPMGDSGNLTVTISAGLAQFSHGESLDRWIERADQALYQAKQSGRNRCLIAEQPPATSPSPAPAAPRGPNASVAPVVRLHPSSP